MGTSNDNTCLRSDVRACKDLDVTFFNPPLEPPRVPTYDSSQERWYLGFRDEESRKQAVHKCVDSTIQSCLEGALQGCAAQAAQSCRARRSALHRLMPRPLAALLGGRDPRSWEEHEACESEAMKACMHASEPHCTLYAQGLCSRELSQDKQRS